MQKASGGLAKANPDCDMVELTLFKVFNVETSEQERLVTRSTSMRRRMELNAEAAMATMKGMQDSAEAMVQLSSGAGAMTEVQAKSLMSDSQARPEARPSAPQARRRRLLRRVICQLRKLSWQRLSGRHLVRPSMLPTKASS